MYNIMILDDTKLLYESDEVINVRIESLMRLFERTSSEDTGQMVLNVFESYRKYLVRDVKFQCKLSRATVEKLINYYMIILCHRKCNEHLSSSVCLIRLFLNFFVVLLERILNIDIGIDIEYWLILVLMVLN